MATKIMGSKENIDFEKENKELVEKIVDFEQINVEKKIQITE